MPSPCRSPVATGVRVRDFPITLDKLLGGLPQGTMPPAFAST
jgi:hypothetical protein